LNTKGYLKKLFFALYGGGIPMSELLWFLLQMLLGALALSEVAEIVICKIHDRYENVKRHIGQ
jgi:hypothetical protein